MKHFALVALLIACGCASQKTTPASSSTPAWKPGTATSAAAASPAPVVGKKAAVAESSKLSCTKQNEVRILEIIKKEKGCDLNYTKSGKNSVVASSSVSTKHCEGSQSKIKGKLESAGYRCQ